MALAGAGAGLRGARGHRPVRRFRDPSRRDHAILGAGAPPGLRQRGPLLGVLLRRPFVAAPRPDRRGAGAVRRRGPRPALLVRRRGRAGVLRDLPAHSGRNVFLRAPAFRRGRGAGRAAGRRLLVRAGRVRPQADDRVRRRRPVDGAARAVRAPAARRRAGGGVAGRLPRGADGGGTDTVRAPRARAARPLPRARREGRQAACGRRGDRVLPRGRRVRRGDVGRRVVPPLPHLPGIQPRDRPAGGSCASGRDTSIWYGSCSSGEG